VPTAVLNRDHFNYLAHETVIDDVREVVQRCTADGFVFCGV
jgi:hypothetical protein